jgi:hypothetical protein
MQRAEAGDVVPPRAAASSIRNAMLHPAPAGILVKNLSKKKG